MARNTRRRQRNITPKRQSSMGMTHRNQSTSDRRKASHRRDSKTDSRKLDKAKAVQREESEASVPNQNGLVLGKIVPVPQTYDPDTYDLNGTSPRTPDREAVDAENYETWGHGRFGDDWLQQRRLMLAERNIYIDFDQVYLSRQRALRVLEHMIERRPFRPQIQQLDFTRSQHNLEDDGWRRLWSRLSQNLPPGEASNNPTSPASCDDTETDSNAGSEDSHVTGFSTFPPTPEPRVYTPPPEDPWERLEYKRKLWRWSDERYHFERVFQREELIDETRKKREDEEGETRHAEELLDIKKLCSDLPQDQDQVIARLLEYESRMKRYKLLCQGLTPEDIEVREREEYAFQKKQHEYLSSLPPRPFPSQPQNQREMEERFRAWDKVGVSRERQNELARIYGFDPRPASPEGPSVSSPAPTTTMTDTTRGISRHTRSGRVAKNDSHAGKKSGGNQQARERKSPRPKTYRNQRVSRRLAGKAPEFGLLR